MRKLRPCVKKLPSWEPSHVVQTSGHWPFYSPAKAQAPCYGFHLVTVHGGKIGQAVHSTCGDTSVCAEECPGRPCVVGQGLCPEQGHPPRVNETQNLAPTLPSQVCALVQGCVCLEKMCLFLILTQVLQGLAGLPGRRTCLQGKGLEQSPEMS